MKITYADAENGDVKPIETEVRAETLQTDADGAGTAIFDAAAPGQYRLSCVVETEAGLRREGGQIFYVRGKTSATQARAAAKPEDERYRFAKLEITADKAEYAPGEKAKLQISSDCPDATVLFFPRLKTNAKPEKARIVKLENGGAVVETEILQGDMPNFYVEAATVFDGQIYQARREIVVPPEKRVMNLDVLPAAEAIRPGEKTKIKLRLTDLDGAPVVGQAVATIYDKSLEQLSGGSNVGDVRAFFWQWRRYADWNSLGTNLRRIIWRLAYYDAVAMNALGVFGRYVLQDGEIYETELDGGIQPYFFGGRRAAKGRALAMNGMAGGMGGGMGDISNMAVEAVEEEAAMAMDAAAAPTAAAAPMMMRADAAADGLAFAKRAEKQLDAPSGAIENGAVEQSAAEPNFVEATVRKNLADVAYWSADLRPDDDGIVEIEVEFPENLTTWKIAAWSVGDGLRVGAGEAEIITRKDVIIRMQKPRFLVRGDVAILSANVHNYLDSEKLVRVSIDFPTDDGGAPLSALVDPKTATRDVVVPAGGETRVDWEVRAEAVGTANYVMTALTDEESDAIQDSLPIYEHGIAKQVAFSGSLDPSAEAKDGVREAKFKISVPKERREDATKLTVRYSPTLAGAIFDALPYLTEYPYGCTEQTLNRFMPLAIAQNALVSAGLELDSLQGPRANLNAQELGDAAERAAQWNRRKVEPVFSAKAARDRVSAGVEKLASMQNGDGGWGWFSGPGERSDAFLTALISRGLKRAQNVCADETRGQLDAAIAGAQNWLRNYQREEARKILRGRVWTDKHKSEPGAWRFY
ncbi:MAG: alpha-2-macroglobulin, partial [Thermoguttaceae bacterium]|nr:alpha-2-macroglobulin [Thermoguttaceae bacterium]